MFLVPHQASSPAVLKRTPPQPVDPRSLSKGLSILTVHVALYLATLIGAVAPLPTSANVGFAIANGVFIALLFIIGHDAGHGSFVPSRNLNAWISRVAFVPCVHAASLWRVIHNKLHHGRTNLKGVDSVWAPMSTDEYSNALPLRRGLERIYRGPLGPLIYYYLEFWIHRVLLPIAPEVRGEWKRHLPDSLFAIGGFLVTLIAIGVSGRAFNPERPLWLVLAVGWVLPFAVWNYLMAFTIYLNHTHPSIPWFRDEASWKRHRGVQADTASVVMPINIAPLYTKVMSHTAHHVRPSVPVYALAQAEAELKVHEHGLLEYRLGLRQYRSIYRACKLFDFERMCWTDFSGKPTAWPLRKA
jgi:omega-6 fatty acid desaturase (delta-12 desaturase)